jgi:very-short-patch-repair endonuclease
MRCKRRLKQLLKISLITQKTVSSFKICPEIRLWHVLRMHQLDNVHFRREHAIGPYIVDCCAPRSKLVIEVDGSQHLDQQEHDERRKAFLIKKGFRVIRFWNAEMMNQLDEVALSVLEAIAEAKG